MAMLQCSRVVTAASQRAHTLSIIRPDRCRCSSRMAGASNAVAAAAAGPQVRPAVASRRSAVACRALNTPGGPGSSKASSELPFKFNPIYLGIIGAYTALLLFRNPYIYAVLTVATVLPQNSNVTSLNNLVLLFYESGLFMNFAEAVTCVRLVTWLSLGYMVGAFALFS